MCRIESRALEWAGDVQICQWEVDLGHRLCPVGVFAGDEGFSLLIGAKGQLYVVLIDTVLEAGSTVEEGLNLLCTGGMLKRTNA